MFNQVMSYIKCLVDFALFKWLLSFFFERKRSLTWDVMTLVLCSALLQFINTLYVPWLNTVSGLIIGLVIALILYQGKLLQICACVSLAVIALLACEFIPIAFSAFVFQDNLAAVMNQTIYDAAFNLIGTGIFFCIILLIRSVSQRGRIGVSTNHFAVCVPLLSVVIIYFMLYTSRFLPGDKNTNIIFVSLYGAIIISNILLIFGERNAERKTALEKELSDLKYKENLTNALIEQQTFFIEEMNGLRHDFKRQLLGLYSLSGHHVSENVPQEYLDEMLAFVDNAQSFDYIESLPLRVIINTTYNKCIKFGIEFISDIRYSNFDFMTYPDIYSFFDNAFENALEACNAIKDAKVRKYISVTITSKGEMVYIQIGNSYPRESALPVSGSLSTKASNRNHGYGTKNILRVANKYNGVLSREINDEYKVTCIFTCIKAPKKV